MIFDGQKIMILHYTFLLLYSCCVTNPDTLQRCMNGILAGCLLLINDIMLTLNILQNCQQ